MLRFSHGAYRAVPQGLLSNFLLDKRRPPKYTFEKTKLQVKRQRTGWPPLRRSRIRYDA
jgi:hypothetical protein